MSRITSVLTTLALAAVGLCGCSSSDSPSMAEMSPAPDIPTAAPRKTTYADANRDGNVTRSEARADPYLAASFDRYDLDQNETLDRVEFARLEGDASGRPAREGPAETRQALRPRPEYPGPRP